MQETGGPQAYQVPKPATCPTTFVYFMYSERLHYHGWAWSTNTVPLAGAKTANDPSNSACRVLSVQDNTKKSPVVHQTLDKHQVPSTPCHSSKGVQQVPSVT